ncbi:MAG: Ycf66 family protein [Aulosira sp. ZfuVER01]|nr:Ycf66 family protein [Aulosira sp. ZfuVER01]MDZ8000669.1 Ycf66 family protein [Aulosira sp. DedVER01a]MDZ8051784.1 Ycf66 family protein [Aulosira sp. ZfuCHP01]
MSILNVLFLLQVNFGFNTASLLGILYIIFGISYMIFMVFLLFRRASRLNSIAFVIYLVQALLIPSVMLLCGFIFVFQGWRLDPILQFAQFLLTILIIYFSAKDILINEVYRNR